MTKTIHHGRNVKRFREMLGIKQEGLAHMLGEDWNQKKISSLEQKDVIDDALLEEVARQLKVSSEVIKNFDEEAAVNIISNTFGDNGVGYQRNENPIFHPVEAIMKLHEEKIALYERMIKEKDDMMERLEKMLNQNK